MPQTYAHVPQMYVYLPKLPQKCAHVVWFPDRRGQDSQDKAFLTRECQGVIF